MRLIVCIWVLALTSTAAAQPRALRTTIELEYRSRDMATHTRETIHAELSLSVRAGRATLHARGRNESRSAELVPGRRSSGGSQFAYDFDQEWTGSAEREGRGWKIHFDRTTATRPSSDPSLDWSCEPTTAEVEGQPTR